MIEKIKILQLEVEGLKEDIQKLKVASKTRQYRQFFDGQNKPVANVIERFTITKKSVLNITGYAAGTKVGNKPASAGVRFVIYVNGKECSADLLFDERLKQNRFRSSASCIQVLELEEGEKSRDYEVKVQRINVGILHEVNVLSGAILLSDY